MALFPKKDKNSQDPFGAPDPYAGQPADPYGGQAPPDPYAQQPDPYGGQQPPAFPDMGQPDPSAQQAFPAADSSPMVDDTRERIEEMTEAIIDEKWNTLMKDITKVIEWKERTDTEIKRIAQDIEHLKERFESLHKGILGKISEYDQNLSNVGSEIKAMEMTFQKILPTFTENVNKLERITKRN